MKKLYALQPYQVGSKNGKSLVVLIPADVAKKCNIDTSTIFTLRPNESTKIVTLQNIFQIQETKIMVKPAVKTSNLSPNI